eukprot:CAMPEP_0204903920 /NCGR_PEP_ID=MMETSP1397-20131031/4561_1 /ASSEMBLY_ACC=CAM_ASM_000891 /TAXON_ID=49980 /ORGANISM="Climacostomum Climacostomum virens, Strain Stock W-24" /LENGTH=51 /DNA_ID=CAMNT_0052072637 /DNA_START=540 /DNA_END=695 /DNA_ORIENTATION=+
MRLIGICADCLDEAMDEVYHPNSAESNDEDRLAVHPFREAKDEEVEDNSGE